MQRIVLIGGVVLGIGLLGLGVQGMIGNALETHFFDRMSAVALKTVGDAWGVSPKKLIAEISLRQEISGKKQEIRSSEQASDPVKSDARSDHGAQQFEIYANPLKPTSTISGKGLTIAVIDESDVSTTTAIITIPTLRTANFLIVEVQTTGGEGKTTNDSIKIYNLGDSPANLKGYRLVKRTKTAIKDTTLKSWTSDAIVPARGYYVWANSDFAAAAADIRTAQTIADDNSVALRYGAENTGEIVDAVAWGTTTSGLGEGVVLSVNPAMGQLLRRKMINGEFQDTNNNSVDFEVR